MKHTTKAKGVEPPKPRNFVAKNAINTGAGAHKDKKKAVKQGDVKHKHKEIAETSEHKLSLMLEMASVQSQINELKQSTKDSYKKKATDQVKELEPHAKDGEYKDLAQRAIDRRKKGLARVAEGDPNAPYTPSPAKPFRNPKGFNKQGTGVGNKLAQQTRAELAKKKEQGVAEGWTHDSLAAELFETPSYENRLQEMLAGQVAFMEGGTDDGVTMFSKSPGSHQHQNNASKPDQEHDLEGNTVKNSLHTIVRVATHLEKAVTDDEEFPEWVSEKIGSIKSMMVSVMDYVISSHEQANGDRLDHGPK